ncbi:MAG TPA: glycosyltransferase [Candidatus Saccharimonadales bacterium]|nr:glycosyltransferase [Candidatus Saccharimonadales bacterium]
MKLTMLGSGSYKSSLTHFRLVTLGQQLGKMGWDVSVLVPSADKYNNFTPDKRAKLAHVELVQPWQPATKNIIINLLPYLLTATWALLRRRPQMVYLYKPTPITIIGLVPKLLFRTPVVVDIDDLGSEVMRLEGQSPLMVKLVAGCERLALKCASAVVVASTYLEARVRADYPNKPVYLMSNWVDPADYPEPQTSTPRPMLYYFGALNRLALIESFLRALPDVFAEVPNARAQILGGGTALAEATALAEELGIADRVTFSGWIGKNDIHTYVRYGDIALCTQPDTPTVRAASNLKVFQYMAMASVPVVSNVGDLPQYINASEPKAAVGVVVPSDDVPALTEELVRLLQYPAKRLEMAAAARKRAVAVYALPVMAIKLQAFLQSVASKSTQEIV